MDIRERDVEDLFYKYGRIRDVELKTPSRPPAYAFITFEDERDAEDAIRARNGYDYDGYRLRVEFSRGKDGSSSGRPGSRDGFRDEGRRGGGRGGGGGRRTEFRVIITGLPRSASWQDLKDHMRKAGDVIYADVDHNGEGVVEFSNREDMESAVRKLDDTEFKNPFDKSYIRVKFANRDRDGRDRRSRSRSDSRSRSRSRDRKDRKSDRRKRSYSRSYSRSPSDDGDRRKRREDDDDDDDKKKRDDEDEEKDVPRVDRDDPDREDDVEKKPKDEEENDD